MGGLNAALGVALLLLAAIGAAGLTPRTLVDPLLSGLASIVLFFAIFLGAFHVQGYAELMTHRPVIGLPLAVAFAAVVVVAAWMAGRRPVRWSPVEANGTRWRPLPVVTAMLVVAVFFVAGLLLLGGVMRGYEVKAYHLPIAIRILRDGTLSLWDQSFMHAYPVNMSVWSGFFLALLPERMVSVADLPFLGLLCAAVFALARAVGADRSAALLVAAGVATIPIVGFSALELGADVAGVAFVTIAVVMLVARPSATTAHATIAGLAGGIAYGFKSLHLVPVAALGLMLLVEGAIDFRRRDTARLRAFAPVAAFTAAAVALMSFWLVRNDVLAGNPLYPVHIAGLFDLFSFRAAPDFDLRTRTDNEKEWVDASWKWLVYPWVENSYAGLSFKHSSGLGAFFAATFPAALLAGPVLLWRRWRGTPGADVRPIAVVYGIGLLVALVWWVLGDRQPRYVMALVVMTAPVTAWLVTRVGARLRTSYEAVLSFCILTMGGILVVQTLATNGVLIVQNAHATRHEWMEYPAGLDRLPAGSVIGNSADREMNFLLYGEGLRNHVVDLLDIERRFGRDGKLVFTAKGVRDSGITHLYVASNRELSTDDCVRLREVDRLDRNPFNGQPYPAPHVVYAIDVTCDGAAH